LKRKGGIAVQVERRIFEVTDLRVVIELPESFRDRRVEVIVLTIDDETAIPTPEKRRPHPAITGKAKILGDLLEPTVSDEEWEASFERTARQLAGDPEAFK
jgi:hypothetical protein